MCSVILAAVLSSSLLGPLKPGPYAVGFQQQAGYDYSRPFWAPRGLDNRARTMERARPMRISTWYPAIASTF